MYDILLLLIVEIRIKLFQRITRDTKIWIHFSNNISWLSRKLSLYQGKPHNLFFQSSHICISANKVECFWIDVWKASHYQLNSQTIAEILRFLLKNFTYCWWYRSWSIIFTFGFVFRIVDWSYTCSFPFVYVNPTFKL